VHQDPPLAALRSCTPVRWCAARARRRCRSSPQQLRPHLQTLLPRLCVVSIIFPPSLVLHAHRSTDACTPANPAPPPFGVDRRGSPTRLLEPLDVCACLSATRRGRSHTKQCPVDDLGQRRRSAAARRRAALISGAPAVVPRLLTSWAMRSVMDGRDHVPLHISRRIRDLRLRSCQTPGQT
jgi:hypothetical protein